MGCINHPNCNDVEDIITSILTTIVNILVPIPTSSHGYEYQKARKEFMRDSLDNPLVADHIKGWINQEIRAKGESGYWRSPPGYDVGHNKPGIDEPDNFRWENSDMNRSRGGKYRR